MSKAEEKAMQYCCAKCVHDKFGCSMKVLSHGENCIKCGNYIKGYHQAEKDLKLSWEDIETIQEIANKYCKLHSCEPRFFVYSEILKRFKDFKEGKEV